MSLSFLDLARRQRACRYFLPDPVPDGDLEIMLETATHAPSAENSQPWVFVVVKDASVRAKLAERVRVVWQGGGRDYALDKIDHRMLVEVDEFIAAGFGGAPVLLVLGIDTARIADVFVASSVYPAAQNLLLAANALGYGSALTNFTVLSDDAVRAVVGLPTTVRPMGIVALGKPARLLGPPRREPVASKAHRDRYGTPWTVEVAATSSEDAR